MGLQISQPTDGKLSALVLGYIDGNGELQQLASTSGTISIGTGGAGGGGGLPYGADQQVIAYVGDTENIATIVYNLAGTTLKTRTFSYDGSGRLTGTVDA